MSKDQPGIIEKFEEALDYAKDSLILLGHVDLCEEAVAKKWPDIDSRIPVERAMGSLVAGAPKEIRQSFEAVISWHRWNNMYRDASRRGDVDTQITAQKQLDSLMTRIH